MGQPCAICNGPVLSPLVCLLVILHHPGVPMHVDVHWDEANGDGQDVTKGTPRQPTIGNKEDVASAVCSAT